jgi:hypothetical protein
MAFKKSYSLCLVCLTSILFTCCGPSITVKEEDKILHAGPAESGLAVMYFGLYKNNKYQFCDGDFMDPGCYTGIYTLTGDTITLQGLRKYEGIPGNRFLIRRYKDMDSSYWQWKYPDQKSDWQERYNRDTSMGATGDIFPLNKEDKIVFEKDNYFLIRFDKLADEKK